MGYAWPRDPDDSRILRCADIVMVLSVSSRTSLLQTPGAEVGCPGHGGIGLCYFLCATIILSANSVYSCDFCGVDIKAF